MNGLNITILGDLKHGRTVHSLVRLLSLYHGRAEARGVRLHYVSPPSLKMPAEIVAELDARGVPQFHYERLEEVLPISDVLYVTRIQKVRPQHCFVFLDICLTT